MALSKARKYEMSRFMNWMHEAETKFRAAAPETATTVTTWLFSWTDKEDNKDPFVELKKDEDNP